MSIYDRPVKELLHDWAEETLWKGQTFSKNDAVEWFMDRYPKVKSNTVGLHIEAMSTNNGRNRRNHKNVYEGSGHDLFYKTGRGEYRLYDPERDPLPVYDLDDEAEEGKKGELTSLLIKAMTALKAEHIHAAMDECSQLGLDAFLGQRGFGRPLKYWTKRDQDETEYPAKAIVAVALGNLEDGRPLRVKEFFNGAGEKESHEKLSELGFEVIDKTELKVRSEPEADAVPDSTKAPAPSAENLILYGPPGTGKTYRTAWEAVRLCLGEQIASGLKGSAQRAALMSTYRKLVSEGRVEFVTFHQSMSYEEFVEGLRPETVRDETSDSTTDPSATGGFRLRVEDGVFKRLARRADASRGQNSTGERLSLERRNVFKMSIGAVAIPDDAGIFDEAITENCAAFGFFRSDFSGDEFTERNAIKARVEQDYTDEDLGFSLTSAVQMTDIFRNNLKQGDVVLVSKGNLLIRAIGMVEGDYEFHPREGSETYPHRRAMRWLWVDEAGMPANEFYDMAISQRTIYPLRKKELNIALVERYMNSQSINKPVSPEPHVLIIDEINRANISKVFGELITLLEPDKRLGMDNEIRLTLPYSKKSFGVPQNLHVICTMNTADRSIALLDTALRRRFAFRELMPNPSVLSNNVEGVDLQKLLTTINERIEYLFDREHQIGHAYLTGCETRVDIESAIRDKVIPLLAEFFLRRLVQGRGCSRRLWTRPVSVP